MLQESDLARATWIDREALAEAMIPLIGRLYRENNVVTSVHGRGLVNQSVVGLLKAHRFARHIDDAELPLGETLPLLQALSTLRLGAASIDVARLAMAYKLEGAGQSLDGFLREQLADVVERQGIDEQTGTDVVLYGFGRIGRLLARILISHAGGGQGLRLRAVVVRRGSENDLIKRASLLRRDSVHGPFEGTITVDTVNNTILANGTLIQVIYSSDPASVDYTKFGIHDAIVVDNTGRWRDAEGLSQHLACPGVSRVLLTAPGKGALKNIVHGINHADIDLSDTIVTAASCTTNAITPVLKAVNDRFGIVDGHVETVHSFTNDQNLIDNFHSGDRRGRSAALNMVLTETGAAKAVAKALPELAGKLTGNAIRVPTPDVSMAILNLTLANGTTRDELNTYLRTMSLHSELHKQIDYIDSPEVVSSDFLGSRRAGIVDGLATICTDNKAVLYVWYDNEFGYSCQVIRVLEEMAGVHPPVFPKVRNAEPVAAF
ncbi:glyceraldehyde-3-phosphate dehydrogenase [Cryobacterium sp. TMT1-21]|uniref:Glyceraldehyde-3-phosphate dehydrogenase n=1 Tax=Cryobacterium shii TaxID=1259235 RepID=A0AAQ2C982_9MICO|nr:MULTISPECIES: glyceraldehyde-3-phosphate dehydrogenase [Cryobacterium]TFC52366.1 glyceraldehyde-3-phosphate dehydrogenase [Cryobacterium shii]TFC87518.1 glyceraldehyde-3-phosphate dehydrogenase [Cryobacterium sp. TmT2-59]TFD10866.1 glyceraldehyde-3-phosphate dehydrogenase [Cryobacterium sp. TMT1-21]TFD16527.1 glyceraldehyde-3-phosphate dehydrogenase [Cryobacterium sp. TMT2-23]TFD20495.1 glyceraldehyde-3-phosphate dehydrogenase [Cryobacterium sp. TMT4-10]